MRLRELTAIFLTMYSLACTDHRADKLFFINETTRQRNDFLFMAESTNASRVDDDSLRLFLNSSDLQHYNTGTVEYKSFGQIHRSECFRIVVCSEATARTAATIYSKSKRWI